MPRPGDWIFVFLTLYGVVIMAWMYLRLPETLAPENKRTLQPLAIMDAVRQALTTRQTLGYMLATGVAQGFLLATLYAAPQVMGELLGMGTYFTVAFGIAAAAMSFGQFLNSQLVGRYGMRLLSHGAVVIGTLLSVALLLLARANMVERRRLHRLHVRDQRAVHGGFIELQRHGDGAAGPHRRHRLVAVRLGDDDAAGDDRAHHRTSLRRHHAAARKRHGRLRRDGHRHRRDHRTRQAVRGARRASGHYSRFSPVVSMMRLFLAISLATKSCADFASPGRTLQTEVLQLLAHVVASNRAR